MIPYNHYKKSGQLNFKDMPPAFRYLKPFHSLDIGGILSTVHHTLFIGIEDIFQGF